MFIRSFNIRRRKYMLKELIGKQVGINVGHLVSSIDGGSHYMSEWFTGTVRAVENTLIYLCSVERNNESVDDIVFNTASPCFDSMFIDGTSEEFKD